MTAVAPAEVFFAKDVLDAGDLGHALMLGAWTVGLTVGGLVVARRLGGAAAALAAIVVQSIGLLVPTLWLVLSWGCAWFLIGGVAHGTKNVVLRTVIHERARRAARARVRGVQRPPQLRGDLLRDGRWRARRRLRSTLHDGVAGLLPALAGLAGVALYARSRLRREGPAAATAEAT